MNIFTKHISLFHVKHLNYKISYYTQTKTQISSHSIIMIIKTQILKTILIHQRMIHEINTITNT